MLLYTHCLEACYTHEGLARETVNPGTRHDGGYDTLCSRDTTWRDVGDLDSFLINTSREGPGGTGTTMAMFRDGSPKLDAFAVGVALQDTREEVLIYGGIGEGLPQGILLICQLLGEITCISPGVGVGRVGGVSLVGWLVPVAGQQ